MSRNCDRTLMSRADILQTKKSFSRRSQRFFYMEENFMAHLIFVYAAKNRVGVILILTLSGEKK